MFTELDTQLKDILETMHLVNTDCCELFLLVTKLMQDTTLSEDKKAVYNDVWLKLFMLQQTVASINESWYKYQILVLKMQICLIESDFDETLKESDLKKLDEIMKIIKVELRLVRKITSELKEVNESITSEGTITEKSVETINEVYNLCNRGLESALRWLNDFQERARKKGIEILY